MLNFGKKKGSCAAHQVEEALQDTRKLQAELDRVVHKIRECERTVGASLEALQVSALLFTCQVRGAKQHSSLLASGRLRGLVDVSN